MIKLYRAHEFIHHIDEYYAVFLLSSEDYDTRKRILDDLDYRLEKMIDT